MEDNVKKYFVFNESSILISYDCPINSKLIIDLSNAKKTIMTNLNDCIIEVVQSINSLLIIFDITKISTDDIITELKKIEIKENDLLESHKTWQIPVCYDLKYAVDLKYLAKEKSSMESVVVNNCDTYKEILEK